MNIRGMLGEHTDEQLFIVYTQVEHLGIAQEKDIGSEVYVDKLRYFGHIAG